MTGLGYTLPAVVSVVDITTATGAPASVGVTNVDCGITLTPLPSMFGYKPTPPG